MWTCKSARGILLGWFLACTCMAHAGGSVVGATEITQLMNNGELIAQVRQQISTVNQLAQSYTVQYQQMREAINAGKSIGNVSLTDITKAKRDLERYQAALRTLGHDVDGLSRVFDTRLTEAKLQGVSVNDYVARESQRIDAGNSLAKARLQQERAQIDQVKDDIGLVRGYGSQIQDTVGVHQSTQLLNQQMNLLLQQMTRLVSLTAQAQGTDKANALNDEAEARARALAKSAQLRQLDADMRARDHAVIEEMRRAK